MLTIYYETNPRIKVMCRMNKAPAPKYQPNQSMCHEKLYETKKYCSIIDIVLFIGNHVLFLVKIILILIIIHFKETHLMIFILVTSMHGNGSGYFEQNFHKLFHN